MERKRKALKPIIKIILSEIIIESIVEKNDTCNIIAETVKQGCKEIKPDINWNSKIPVICNSMREYVKYKIANIISEDRDFNGFTISITEF